MRLLNRFSCAGCHWSYPTSARSTTENALDDGKRTGRVRPVAPRYLLVSTVPRGNDVFDAPRRSAGRRASRVTLLCLTLMLVLGSNSTSADDSPLTLADLDAYRLALLAKPDASAPEVKFRDLWDRPEAYAGRVVKVEGLVARQFRQGRFGEFPPLAEVWVVSPAGDPFCLVFPLVEGRGSPEIGATVRFSGTFVKRIKYQGGDTARVAPLLVGPQPPSDSSIAPESLVPSWSTSDWMMALGAGLIVAMILARRHFAHPDEPVPTIDPAPVFVDGDRMKEGGSCDELA
jgi:hypothetical protein